MNRQVSGQPVTQQFAEEYEKRSDPLLEVAAENIAAGFGKG